MPARREGLSGADLRRISISEYGMWLQARTNKHHRPFQHDTMLAYTETARVLDRWMSKQDIDGDFTACDTPLQNRFFAASIATHGQGGTNTRQRNLRHLFTWLEDAYGDPHPYTDTLHRYSPVKTGPPPSPTSSSTTCWPSPAPATPGASKTSATTRSSAC
jgi:integrase/recombinase XerD